MTSDERSAAVLKCASTFALEAAGTLGQRATLQTALIGLHQQAGEWQAAAAAGLEIAPPFMHLPLLIHGGLSGDLARAVPVAAACSLLFLGLDIFDDLADGDTPLHWEGVGSAQRNLAAATLLCSLPQLLISQLEAPPATRDAMQRVLARGLLEMSGGQHSDISGVGSSEFCSVAVEASVASKSGAEMETFARLAALFAGASAADEEHCASVGRAIGTAGQLSSDCHELFQDPQGRDFRNGARTLPLAFHGERLQGEERSSFVRLLEQGREDEAAREDVRRRLLDGGDLRRCAFVVETRVQRGLRAVDALPLEAHARDELLAMLQGLSFFAPPLRAPRPKPKETKMNRETLETLMDKWTNEPNFREQLKADPEGTVDGLGLQLSEEERATLRAMDFSLSDEELQARASKAA